MLNFNTPETLNALGVAAGTSLRCVFLKLPARPLPCKDNLKKKIARFETAQENQYPVTEQKIKQLERSIEYDRDHVQQTGQLQPAEPLPPQEPEVALGKYALLRRKFLKENRRITYTNLLTSGKLNGHLAEIEQTALSRMDQMVEQMAKTEGVTEELKARDPMTWVGLMNNCKAQAEEILLTELIYS